MSWRLEGQFMEAYQEFELSRISEIRMLSFSSITLMFSVLKFSVPREEEDLDDGNWMSISHELD